MCKEQFNLLHNTVLILCYEGEGLVGVIFGVLISCDVLYLSAYGVVGASFSNYTEGIKSASVFDVPTECQNATVVCKNVLFVCLI